MKRPNTLKQLFRDRKPALGGWLTQPGALKTEVFAAVGFDWIVVDLQHGALTLSDAIEAVKVIEDAGPTALVRVPWNEPSIIMRALDAGASGVVVPLVNSPAEARAAVAATRYPPQGNRSSGPWRAGLDGQTDYQAWANDEVICMVMVETREAVEQVEEIAATPGLDGIYVGPSDLSLAYGLMPAPDQSDPAWAAAIDRIVGACEASGIAAGIAGNANVAVKRLAQGFRFLEVSRDSTALREGAAQHLAHVREARPH